MSISLENALRVYQIVAPYLPQDEVEPPALASRLISGMSAEQYIECLMLMTGNSRKLILDNPDAALWLTYFVDGLERIQIWMLAEFCKTIGLAHV